jgi:hypothetical protein
MHMRKFSGLVLLLAIVVLSSFYQPKQLNTLKGTWQYAGDILNGKKEEATDDIRLRRRYTDTDFAAYFNEKDSTPMRYEAGTYKLVSDTCLETETWSGMPSKLLNVTIHYHYAINHDTLILSGVLPGGAITVDYWKRVE